MTRADFEDRLALRAAAAGISLPAGLMDALSSYYDVLARWNRKINLTAVSLSNPTDEGIDRLFVEPVAAASFANPGGSLIDIGTGSGSPAIPFALAAGASTLTMVESRTRKSVFLREAARTLALPARVITERYEVALEDSGLTSAFDALTLRAVRVDPSVMNALMGFVRIGGSLFLFQSDPSHGPVKTVNATTHRLTANAVVAVLKRV